MANERQGPVHVRVRVDVIVDGGKAQVHFQKGEPPVRFTSLTWNITIPRLGTSGRVALVKTSDNTICARGTVNMTSGCMFARVRPGSVTSTQHPDCDPSVRCCPIDSSGAWEFSAQKGNPLTGASSSQGGEANTLLLWAQDADGTDVDSHSVPFLGISSTATDCDGSGPSLLAAAGFPLLAALQDAQSSGALRGTFQDRTGAFSSWPESVHFTPECSQSSWHWTAPDPQFGSLRLFLHEGAFLLRSCVSDPVILAPKTGSSRQPLHLVFEVTGDSAHPGSFTLHITE